MYYTPLFFHNWNWNNNVLSWRWMKRKSCTDVLLGYGGSKIWHDVKDKPLLNEYYPKMSPEKLKVLKSQAQYLGQPVPGDQEDLKKWVEDQIKAAPEEKELYAGFFPLFHWEQTPDKTSMRTLHFFYGCEKNTGFDYSVFGP